ncbi:MAG: AMP-binding protein [Actinomycetota bacterium]|nr:AMP-binding protein [Actinomycetota bacterium]
MTPPPAETQWLARAAAATPEAVALVEDDGTAITYGELDALADEAAARVRDTVGVSSGDITVVAVNSVGTPLVAMLWGAWRIGVVPLMIDQRSPLVRDWGSAARKPWEMELSPTAPPGRLHTVVLTSGSTVGARPVRLTHRNVAAAVAASQERLANDATDRWLLTLPLFHVGALSILWRSAAVGGTVVIHEEFDAARSAGAMKDGSVTIASLVPTMLHRILDVDPGPYHGMRGVLLGGAAANQGLVEGGLDAGLPILQTYGMTEACSQIATVAPGEEAESLGTAGRPLDGMEVTIDGSDVGEIIIDGAAVSPGYLGEPDREGGHRTRDLGYFDDAGRLVVLGRADDMVVTGGENVYPQRVADVLSRHRFVQRVEVVGVPDAEWGQALVAIVVGDGTTRRRVERWAQERLARHEVPKEWVFVEELPLLAGGKVDRAALQELARHAL